MKWQGYIYENDQKNVCWETKLACLLENKLQQPIGFPSTTAERPSDAQISCNFHRVSHWQRNYGLYSAGCLSVNLFGENKNTYREEGQNWDGHSKTAVHKGKHEGWHSLYCFHTKARGRSSAAVIYLWVAAFHMTFPRGSPKTIRKHR